MKRLHLSLLGSFQAQRDGEDVFGFRSEKVRGLLAYLAVEPDRAHRREELAALFWGNYSDRSARVNLRMALSNLRKILAPLAGDTESPSTSTAADAQDETPVIQISRQQVTFRTGPSVFVDVHSFMDSLDACRRHPHQSLTHCLVCIQRLHEAVDLYQGDFLSGLSIEESPDFDEWRRMLQEQLHQQALTALHTLTVHQLEREEFDQAETFARRQLALAPWQEEAHRQLIQALAAAGRRSAALAQYQECRAILAEELGVPPSPETDAIYHRLQKGGLDDDAGILKTGELKNGVQKGRRAAGASAIPPSLLPQNSLTAHHNLPAQMTPFLGRETELADLRKHLLDPVHRLLTIVGAGGVGKTRLALAAAHRMVERFADGVWFVPLAGTIQDRETEPAALQDTMVTAIASSVAMTFHGSADPKTQLLNHLRPREMLLVLDNTEHLLEGEPATVTELLLEILQEAPEVKLLVTSRQRLGLQAEYVLQLEGLPVAANGELQEARRSPSVQLFLERAERSPGGFTLTPDELLHITRLCRFVSGLPLAIELAATWITHYSCAEIVQAMEENLDFLATPMPDLPARHRSMRAVFEESWRLLSHQERSILAQASVFRGDFSRKAALSITGATVQTLTALVDRSLLRRTAAGRYELHELLRQFATEKRRMHSLEEPGASGPAGKEDTEEDEELEARHSAFYLTFLQEREDAIDSSRSRQTLAEIRQDFDNIRKAWRWAVGQGDVALVQAGLKALSRYFTFSGLFQEGEHTFRASIQQIDKQIQRTADTRDLNEGALRRVQGKLLVEQAHFLNRQGNYDAAVAAAQRAIRLAEQAKDPESLALAHVHLGHGYWRQGDLTTMRTQLERALALARENALADLEAYVLSRFAGLVLTLGEYAQARAYLEQYLHFCREHGHREGEGIAYNNLGYLYHACYDYGKALTYFQHSLAIKQEMGTPQGEGMAVVNLGAVYLNLGDYARALTYYTQALAISRDIGEQRLEGLALSNLTLLYHLQSNDIMAQEYGRQALHITQEVGDRPTQGYVLTHLGHALAGRGEWEDAAQAYGQAAELRRSLDSSDNTIMESIAGLAHVHWAQGNTRRALAAMEEFLPRLETQVVEGLLEPLRVYLTCYRILEANQDPRADAVLAAAHQLLQTSAGRIEDESLRRSFLENVAVHREILEEKFT